jgi:anti-sigma-K factor RskA
VGQNRAEGAAGTALRDGGGVMSGRLLTCDELRDVLELYALGVLEDEEKSQIDEHLARACETCQRNLRDALALNALVMGSVAPTAPRVGLKRRVLAGFGIERAGWGWLGAFAAALMLVLAAWLSVQERRREGELGDARSQVIQIAAERDRLKQAISLLNQPETRQVNFGAGKPQQPKGNIFINPRLGVLLIASELPALPSGKTFEMWIIPSKDSSPRPTGLFKDNGQGTGINLLPGPVDSLYAIAVSIEPEAGAQTPSDVILVAPVPGA